MTGRPYKNVPTSININPIYSTHCQPIHNHRRMDHLENWSPRSLAKVLKPTKLWFLIKNLHPSWFSSHSNILTHILCLCSRCKIIWSCGHLLRLSPVSIVYQCNGPTVYLYHFLCQCSVAAAGWYMGCLIKYDHNISRASRIIISSNVLSSNRNALNWYRSFVPILTDFLLFTCFLCKNKIFR